MENHETDNAGNGQHTADPKRDAQGRWIKGVTGNPNGRPPESPIRRIFRAFVEEAGREEHVALYMAKLREEIQANPTAFMRDFWNRTPKDVQVAVLATLLTAEEKEGLVKKFDVAGGQDRAVDLIHEALTRTVEAAASERPPSRG